MIIGGSGRGAGSREGRVSPSRKKKRKVFLLFFVAIVLNPQPSSYYQLLFLFSPFCSMADDLTTFFLLRFASLLRRLRHARLRMRNMKTDWARAPANAGTVGGRGRFCFSGGKTKPSKLSKKKTFFSASSGSSRVSFLIFYNRLGSITEIGNESGREKSC